MTSRRTAQYFLTMEVHPQGDKTYYHLYDGHGNVKGLFDPEGVGSVVGEYEYGPFGELLRESGQWSHLSRFRHATKWNDSDSDLLYYGYRFYDPGQGRFLNRDPIEEAGGVNLYAFVANDPVNAWDYLGLLIPMPITGVFDWLFPEPKPLLPPPSTDMSGYDPCSPCDRGDGSGAAKDLLIGQVRSLAEDIPKIGGIIKGINEFEDGAEVVREAACACEKYKQHPTDMGQCLECCTAIAGFAPMGGTAICAAMCGQGHHF